MSTNAKQESPLQARLDSWKSVAGYLNRSCRTVQRWNREYGLPIRHLGGEKGSIFAYPHELDDWLRGRGRLPKREPDDISQALSRRHNLRSIGSIQPRGTPSPSLVSPLDRMRSADLVAVAEQMRATISDTNMGSIAQLFRKAADLDPFNAEAFAGFAHALITEVLWGNLCGSVAYPQAQAALHRALVIEPESPEALCALAWFKMLLERDWQGAARGFDNLLQHHPAKAGALMGRALLHIAEGFPQKSSVLLLANSKDDVLSSPVREGYCWSEYLAGEYSNAVDEIGQARASGYSGVVFDTIEALAAIQAEEPSVHIRRIETLVANSPRNDVLQGARGFAYAMNGQSEKACEIIDSIRPLRTDGRNGEPYAIALILIGLNDRTSAIHWLEQSFKEGSLWSLGFPCDPILAALKDDPHYQTFLRKAKYPDSGNGAQGSDLPDNEKINQAIA